MSVDSVSNQPVIVLRPTESDTGESDRRLVPIWIGQNEATAIFLALQGVETPRPMTHDLLFRLVESVGYTLSRIEVTKLEEGTFFAELVLAGPAGEVRVDARPSDSIALAVRARCPIFCAEAVLDEAGIVPEVIEGAEEISEEKEVERFRDFLERIEPSDFQ